MALALICQLPALMVVYILLNYIKSIIFKLIEFFLANSSILLADYWDKNCSNKHKINQFRPVNKIVHFCLCQGLFIHTQIIFNFYQL